MSISQISYAEQVALYKYMLLEESGYDNKVKSDYNMFLQE